MVNEGDFGQAPVLLIERRTARGSEGTVTLVTPPNCHAGLVPGPRRLQTLKDLLTASLALLALKNKKSRN